MLVCGTGLARFDRWVGRNDAATVLHVRFAVGRLILVGLVTTVALVGATGAVASTNDDVILNQTQVTNTSPYSGSGPEISGLTVTTYGDGTVSFVVQFANRAYLETGETLQIFVDLNDDGQGDVNLSIWPSFQPSYLAKWNGSGWSNIRQLPELVQASGSISERVSLSELQSDANVPVGPTIGVAVASWTEDSSGSISGPPNDALPSATGWVQHSINAPAAAATTQTTSTTTSTTPQPSPTTKPAGAKIPPPVTIEHLAALNAVSGKDVTLHILLKSRPGPTRLFKVCAQIAPSPGVLNLTQCRSLESSGANGVVPFTITYRISRLGITRVAIHASAGTATAAATAILHIAKAP